jgi:hypothetical protein
VDFKNLNTEQETLLNRILETGRYLRFATRNKVAPAVVVSQAEQLGIFVDDLDRPPKPK